MARPVAPTALALGATRARSRDRRDDPELSRLLSLLSTGDVDAFAAFYDATSPLVYGLVLTVVRSPAQAADLTQALYVEIWRDPQVLLTRRVTVLAALLGLAQRRAVEGARACATAPRLTVGRVTRRNRLSLPRTTRMHARPLSPLQQEILVLSYLGGYTVRQVSALLSLPTPTVREALTDALSELAPASAEAARGEVSVAS